MGLFMLPMSPPPRALLLRLRWCACARLCPQGVCPAGTWLSLAAGRTWQQW